MKKVIIFFIFLLLINFTYAYEVEYVHQDHLGNNIAITNEQGEVIWKADYEPFGQSFNEQGTNSYKYNSKELDKNTDLYYYGARYYDADIGRFTTADTISGNIKNPQSLNRYVYTLNNPLKYVDPTGKQAKISDEGWLKLIELSSVPQDTTLRGADFGNLKTKLPFNDLRSIEKRGKEFIISINTDKKYYSIGIPSYAVDVGRVSLPPFFVSAMNRIGIGRVKTSKSFTFEQIKQDDIIIYSLTSGSISIELSWVAKQIANILGGEYVPHNINVLSIIKGESSTYGYTITDAYLDKQGKMSYGWGFFDLEKQKIMLKGSEVPEEVMKKSIIVDDIIEQNLREGKD